ncbi:MAG: hypothetical protein AAFZ52_04730, partial [Bacteroidota bacterium]
MMNHCQNFRYWTFLLSALLVPLCCVATVNPVDSIFLEAEAAMVEAPMLIKTDTTASGGAYVEVAAGNNSFSEPPATGSISFTAELQAGTYKIWGRVLTPAGEDDSFWVKVDDGPAYKWNQIGTQLDWTWVAVHDNNSDNAVLEWTFAEASTHQITLYYREDGARIDEIYVTNLGDTPTKGDLPPAAGEQAIYVSQEEGVDENNLGSTPDNPVKTLARAYAIARANAGRFLAFRILLRRGETYSDFAEQTSPVFTDADANRNTFAFIWDIDRRLTLGAYGTGSPPHLYGFRYRHEGFPTSCLGVVSPSKQPVVIRDLSIERFQVCAINIFETQDV